LIFRISQNIISLALIENQNQFEMRRLLFVFIGIVLCIPMLSAQDVIYKVDGNEIQAKVVEIEKATIKYRLFSQPEGPIRNIDKSDVFMIIYQDGTREKFTGKDATKPEESKKIIVEQPAPIPGAPKITRELTPVGTLVIISKEKGKLFFDNDPIKNVTPYHKLIIHGIEPGMHTFHIEGEKKGRKETVPASFMFPPATPSPPR
jgi:hypothetical protein